MEGNNEEHTYNVNGYSPNRPVSFNLSIMSPAMGGQGYILNPVPQSMMAYPYITLPAQNGGDMLSMPMPMLQIISNEGNPMCNNPILVKPLAMDNNNGFLKADTDQMADMVDVSGMLRKPCPLEMSIKAANIGMEDDADAEQVALQCGNAMQLHALEQQSARCMEMQQSVQPMRTLMVQVQQPLNNTTSVIQRQESQGMIPPPPQGMVGVVLQGEQAQPQEMVVMQREASTQGAVGVMLQGEPSPQNTMLQGEEDQGMVGVVVQREAHQVLQGEAHQQQGMVDVLMQGQPPIQGRGGLQESLICEVEEANEDSEKDEQDDSEESDDEMDRMPLSMVLRFRKVKEAQDVDKDLEERDSEEEEDSMESEEEWEGEEKSDEELWAQSGRKRPHPRPPPQQPQPRAPKGANVETKQMSLYNVDGEYNLHGATTEPPPAQYYWEGSKSFIRVGSCCVRKECYKKISLLDQRLAFSNFNELGSREKQDSYLSNCIDLVKKKNKLKRLIAEEDNKTIVNTQNNIQLEIENESNGNQTLSDEIQKAIDESLRDCMAAEELPKVEQEPKEEKKKEEVEEKKPEVQEKEEWQYFLLLDRCRRRVCLRFLVKLLRIPRKRIWAVQKMLQSGAPLEAWAPSSPEAWSPASADVWTSEDEDDGTRATRTTPWTVAAAEHLATLTLRDVAHCKRKPPHTALEANLNCKKTLYQAFKQFFWSRLHMEAPVKFKTYVRFLSREWKDYSFLPQRPNSCADCMAEKGVKPLKPRIKRVKGVKGLKAVLKKAKAGKRTAANASDSDDDKPLIKRKKLKMTISLKKMKEEAKIKEARMKELQLKEAKMSEKIKNSKCKPKKGRDVWSLMLLHLGTMTYRTSRACLARKKHRYLPPYECTTRSLYDDYRKYFLKETNSELGLGFAMYEKYFHRVCGYTIAVLEDGDNVCPRCAAEPQPPPKPFRTPKGPSRVVKPKQPAKAQPKKDRSTAKSAKTERAMSNT